MALNGIFMSIIGLFSVGIGLAMRGIDRSLAFVFEVVAAPESIFHASLPTMSLSTGGVPVDASIVMSGRHEANVSRRSAARNT